MSASSSSDDELHEIRLALRADIERLSEELLGPRNKALSNRREWRFGSKGSVGVYVSGPKKGGFGDYESESGKGGPAGADVLQGFLLGLPLSADAAVELAAAAYAEAG